MEEPAAAGAVPNGKDHTMTAHLTLVPRPGSMQASASHDHAEPDVTAPCEPRNDLAHSRPVPPSWVPAPPQRRSRLARVFSRLRPALENDRGAVTAEYAIVIMAAVAFAGLLVAIMRSGEIRGMLVQLVESALSAAG